MLEKEFLISRLISLQIKGELKAEQETVLNNWLAEKEERKIFLEEFYDQSTFNSEIERYISKDKTAIWNKVTRKLGAEEFIPIRNKIFLLRAMTVAASIVLMIGIGTYFLNDYFKTAGPDPFSYVNDISPGSNKATLTLSNGEVIALRNNYKSLIVDAGKLMYNDGSAVISGKGTTFAVKDTELKINTPRGGQYEAVLPDGTRVWLNAASTLTFPSKFIGGDRKVTLKGEAYFEVFKDKQHPFIVKADNQEIEVLGTHFNVNSYSDETTVNTTLLEGSIRINHQLTLKPNEQSNLYKNGKIVVSKANENAIAWKDGNFVFEKEDIQSIMRKVERWYNVEIVYQGERPKELYSGITKRSGNVSQILSILEETGTVKFKIEGNKIILSKNN